MITKEWNEYLDTKGETFSTLNSELALPKKHIQFLSILLKHFLKESSYTASKFRVPCRSAVLLLSFTSAANLRGEIQNGGRCSCSDGYQSSGTVRVAGVSCLFPIWTREEHLNRHSKWSVLGQCFSQPAYR